MKISLNWLNDFIKVDKSNVAALAEGLTNRGIEAESIDVQGQGMDDVIVGKILSREKHPDADKLSLLKVDVGKETLQIVCGASNMKAGDKVAVSLVGAKLPNGLEIKKTKIRGVESYGMCCSLSELKLADESQGIIILPEDAKIGTKVTEVLGLNDVLIEFATPPNRGDVLGHLGIAREASYVLGTAVEYNIGKIKSDKKDNGGLTVDVKDKRCGRYIGRMISGIKIKPSPQWLCQRLESIGLNPINNVVDITNYVMFEIGHPLHAFDAKKVSGHKIIVRSAKDGEVLKLLDETEKKLSSKDMLICDEKKPLAIAGVMGGEYSGISDDTTDVILECAYFEPSAIRVTSTKHNISTDSSYRFERGTDFDFMPMVVERTTQLMKELADAKCVYECVDVISDKKTQPVIKISEKTVNEFLGTNIKEAEIKKILSSMGFKVEGDKDGLKVTPPSFRGDITMPADFYEEIARIYGYDKIPAELPSVVLSPEFKFMDKSELLKISLRDSLKGMGYLETITYSFVPEHYHTLLGLNDKDVVKVKNPISEAMKVMRTSLVPSLIESVKYNFNRRNLDLKIFEIGNIYRPGQGGTARPKPTENVAVERETLVCVSTGRLLDTEDWTRNSAKNSNDKQDYYVVKGELTALLNYLRVPNVNFAPLGNDAPKYLHPGSASIIKCCGKQCGYIGRVHPEFAKAFELDTDDVYILELYLDAIKGFYNTNISFKELPKFPSMRRDISFLIDEKTGHASIASYIRKLKVANLKECNMFDLYKGKGVPDGKKSMAWYFIFANDERTLVDSEADEAVKAVIEGLKREFSVEIR